MPTQNAFQWCSRTFVNQYTDLNNPPIPNLNDLGAWASSGAIRPRFYAWGLPEEYSCPRIPRFVFIEPSLNGSLPPHGVTTYTHDQLPLLAATYYNHCKVVSRNLYPTRFHVAQVEIAIRDLASHLRKQLNVGATCPPSCLKGVQSQMETLDKNLRLGWEESQGSGISFEGCLASVLEVHKKYTIQQATSPNKVPFIHIRNVHAPIHDDHGVEKGIIDLGNFYIFLPTLMDNPPSPRRDNGIDPFFYLAADPARCNIMSGVSGRPDFFSVHPHNTDSNTRAVLAMAPLDFCWGPLPLVLHNLLRQGLLPEAIDLVVSGLHTYNQNSPYLHLDYREYEHYIQQAPSPITITSEATSVWPTDPHDFI